MKPETKTLVIKIYLTVIVCAFLLCFAVAFQSKGIDQGLVVVEIEEKSRNARHGVAPVETHRPVFRTYEAQSLIYCYLAFYFASLLFFGLLIKNRKKESFALIASAFTLILTLRTLYGQISLKQGAKGNETGIERLFFIKTTIPYDWILLIVSICLLLFILSLSIQQVLESKKTKVQS